MGEFIFDIRTHPGAKRNAVGGKAGEPPRLVVSVQAPAEGGAANAAVIKVIAKALNLRPKDIEIIYGDTNRDKRIKATGDVIEIQKLHLALLNK
jgi:uncharacterized protein